MNLTGPLSGQTGVLPTGGRVFLGTFTFTAHRPGSVALGAVDRNPSSDFDTTTFTSGNALDQLIDPGAATLTVAPVPEPAAVLIAAAGVLAALAGNRRPRSGRATRRVADVVATHRRLFGRAPGLLAADRGFATPKNEQLAKESGVTRVCIPFAGRAPPGRQRPEKERWFRRGYRFRAGIEGRVHALRRDFGLRRCRYRGETGMGRWVGWGILAHNLDRIAGAVARRAG